MRTGERLSFVKKEKTRENVLSYYYEDELFEGILGIIIENLPKYRSPFTYFIFYSSHIQMSCI
jgi:hypothetical protein